jgi:hypothetical protein
MRAMRRVRRPTIVPDNRGYMIAGYIVAAALYGGYALWLWYRARKS